MLHIYNRHWLLDRIVTPDVTLQDHSDTLQGQIRIVYNRLVTAMEKVDIRWGGFNLDLARKPGDVFTVHLLVLYMVFKKRSQEQL